MPRLSRWFKMLRLLKKRIRREDNSLTSKMMLTIPSIMLNNSLESTVIKSHRMSKTKLMVTSQVSMKL